MPVPRRGLARYSIYNGRNQPQCPADRATMTAGVATLSDNDICPRRCGSARHRKGLNLQDQGNPGRLDTRDVQHCIAEREHDRSRRRGDGGVECRWIAAELPGNETYADPRIAGGCNLAAKSRFIVTRRDQAERPSLRDRVRQHSTGGASHWRCQDGMLDPKQPSQGGFNTRHIVPPVCPAG